VTQRTAHLDSEPVVPAAIAAWAALEELLSALDEDQWSAGTCLPGWRVRDIVAHLIGIEAQLAGEPVPAVDLDVEALPHVHNALGAANERWVQALRTEDTGALLDRFRGLTRERATTLAELSTADLDAPSWTPVGEGTYRRMLEIRVFDCWLHDQDIRDAIGRPGHETGLCAERSVDEVARVLGYVVGKRARAPQGAAVTIELTGPVCRTLHVLVDGPARVVDELDRPATATLRLSSGLFVRFGGGRVDPARHLAEVAITGDADLGRQIVTHLAFTP
jgi:uncharacterized protein (TIGR03083 family)